MLDQFSRITGKLSRMFSSVKSFLRVTSTCRADKSCSFGHAASKCHDKSVCKRVGSDVCGKRGEFTQDDIKSMIQYAQCSFALVYGVHKCVKPGSETKRMNTNDHKQISANKRKVIIVNSFLIFFIK